MTYKTVAIRAAKKAGQALQKLSERKIVRSKGAHDILAEGDLVSERIILEEIRRNFPAHSILSEEEGKENHGKNFRWIIDPIDGTINFSRYLEEWCISIALEHRNELKLGLIYQPVLNKLYVAERGKGATLNGHKLSVSKQSKCVESILATDNSGNIPGRIGNFKLLANICDEFRHVRIFGSGSLHLARIAEGQIDVYYKTQFNYWDYAAGMLLVDEAGGKVTDFRGQKASSNSRDILASNGLLHRKALELIRSN